MKFRKSYKLRNSKLIGPFRVFLFPDPNFLGYVKFRSNQNRTMDFRKTKKVLFRHLCTNRCIKTRLNYPGCSDNPEYSGDQSCRGVFLAGLPLADVNDCYDCRLWGYFSTYFPRSGIDCCFCLHWRHYDTGSTDIGILRFQDISKRNEIKNILININIIFFILHPK